MVFKPFKSPLIRNPVPSSTENIDESVPPAKKPRLLSDEPTPDPDAKSTPLASRKPLIQITNKGSESSTSSSVESPKEVATDEKYFNVLW
jgi:DNA repair and recombination protein RAD54B